MALSPEQFTIIGLLLAIGAAGIRRIWVFGWTYEAKARETEFWQNIALRLLKVNEKALPEKPDA